jgi:hypothetical protein
VAIVALLLASVLAWLAGRQGNPQTRRIMLVIAAASAGFALYLILFAPEEAWDLRWLGRLLTRLTGQFLRDMLR